MSCLCLVAPSHICLPLNVVALTCNVVRTLRYLQQMRGGDDDIVPRKPLHERRAAFDAVAARRAAAADAADADMEYDYEGGGRGSKRQQQPEEDEFYTAAKAARQSSKSAKQAKHQVRVCVFFWEGGREQRVGVQQGACVERCVKETASAAAAVREGVKCQVPRSVCFYVLLTVVLCSICAHRCPSWSLLCLSLRQRGSVRSHMKLRRTADSHHTGGCAQSDTVGIYFGISVWRPGSA